MILKNHDIAILVNVNVTGCTWDIFVSIDGQPYSLTIASTMTDNDDGTYTLVGASADMNANLVDFLLVETDSPSYDSLNPIKYEITISTDDISAIETMSSQMDGLVVNMDELVADMDAIEAKIIPGGGTVVWTYTTYGDSNYITPLDGVVIVMTTDYAGQDLLGEQVSGSDGVTRWLVNPGQTYYMWRRKSGGWIFDNPDIQIINSVAPFSAMSG
jgi:hypothetical protein